MAEPLPELYELPFRVAVMNRNGGYANANNLAAATLGNIVGGAVLVGLVYWFVYLRPSKE